MEELCTQRPNTKLQQVFQWNLIILSWFRWLVFCSKYQSYVTFVPHKLIDEYCPFLLLCVDECLFFPVWQTFLFWHFRLFLCEMCFCSKKLPLVWNKKIETKIQVQICRSSNSYLQNKYSNAFVVRVKFHFLTTKLKKNPMQLIQRLCLKKMAHSHWLCGIVFCNC